MKDLYKLTFDQARKEFNNVGDYITEAERVLVVTGLHWTDQSWHNDVCPHVVSVNGGLPLVLWFDSSDEPEAGDKLALYVWHGSVSQSFDTLKHTIYSGNSWFELIGALTDVLENERLPPMPQGLDIHSGFIDAAEALVSARKWVKELVIRNMAFHFEDDPFDQVRTGTGGEPAFTRIQAASLAATVALFGDYSVDLCTMYFQALDDMGLYDGADDGRGVLSRDQAITERLNPPSPVTPLVGAIIVDDEHLVEDLQPRRDWVIGKYGVYRVHSLGNGVFNVMEKAEGGEKIAVLNGKELKEVAFDEVMNFVAWYSSY